VEDIIFHEGIVPSGFHFDYEASLFNLPEHLALQSREGWISFYVLQDNKKLVLAGIHFHIADRVASSPYRSPFGSVEASQKIEPITLFKFLEFVNLSLIEKGLSRIIIKTPPVIYNNEIQTLVHTFLLNLKYHISNAETGAVLLADKSFEKLSQHWEKRKVRHAKAKELTLRHHSGEDLKLLYDFILACREKKGYSTSMTYEDLHKVVTMFPERFLLTSIHHEEKLVAASVSIKVNHQVLYHFYSDHLRPINDVNPTLFLIKELYEYAVQNNIAMVDLGTSSSNGLPNFGLLDFKLRVGATLTSKFTFEKRLTQ
jgi:lipid II:glycine glycyltransferase (peptidoglycan interpeptide bridge formation enzyme)